MPRLNIKKFKAQLIAVIKGRRVRQVMKLKAKLRQLMKEISEIECAQGKMADSTSPKSFDKSPVSKLLTKIPSVISTQKKSLSALSTRANSSEEEIYDVIVIGGGIAGLEATLKLQAQGAKVLVLEGRDRLGGRIFTEKLGKTAIDLGASWIHGIGMGVTEREELLAHEEKWNPLYEYAFNHRIMTIPTW